MAKKPALRTVRADFDRRRQAALDLFEAVEPFAIGTWHAIQGWEPLYPGQARRITALAFMHLVIGWEDLVEATFVRYLAGAIAPSNWVPRLRLGPASSIDHAYQLVSGSPSFRRGADYITWGNWKDVLDRASVYFVGAEPYSRVSELERDRLQDASKIRNRVAHASGKSKEQFIELARRHLGLSPTGKLPKGFDVGQLLINKKSKCFGHVTQAAYFRLYHAMFADIADRICPT